MGTVSVATAPASTAATVSTTTANILGSPVNQAGTAAWGLTDATVTLTAVRIGNDIAVTIAGSHGPATAPFAGVPANGYQIQAFVRLDGASNTRGTRFDGPIGNVPVAPASVTYPGGFTINGTFTNVPPGMHVVTLTDIGFNTNGPSAGNDFGTPTGFDVYFNTGTTTAQIVAGSDWQLSVPVEVFQPTATVQFPGQLSGVAAVRDAAAGFTVDVTGYGWPASLAPGAITACVATSSCWPFGGPSTFPTNLTTNAGGQVSGTVSVPAGLITSGQGTLVLGEQINNVSVVVPFTALGERAVNVNPPFGTYGASITVSGSSFDPLRPVTVRGCSNAAGTCVPTSDPPSVGNVNSVGSFVATTFVVNDPSTQQFAVTQDIGGDPSGWPQVRQPFTFLSGETVISVNALPELPWRPAPLSSGAIVQVSGVGPSSGGSLEVALYGPDDPTCSGAPFDSTEVPIAAPTGGVSTTLVSAQTGLPGTYSWLVSYVGGVDVEESTSACGGPTGVTTVTPGAGTVNAFADAAQVELGQPVSDVVTLDGVTENAGGTIEVALYAGTACTGTPLTTESIPVNGPDVYTSAGYAPAAIGDYRWVASYSGDANNGPSTTTCSDAAQAFTVVSVPDAPTGLTSATGDGTVTVGWTAPTSTGGLPLDGYVVTVVPGGDQQLVDPRQTSVQLTGLANGTAYTVSVQAANALGASDPLVSPPLTPSAAPGAPASASATPGDTTATVSWTPPAFDGGSAITAYRVTNVQTGVESVLAGSTLSLVVDQLTNGTAYEFDVVAVNQNGPSAPTRTAPVIPVGAPQPVEQVGATARGDGELRVTWESVTDTGGSPLARYDVRVWESTATSASATVTPVRNVSAVSRRITGLDVTKSYFAGVRAVNTAGLASEWSDIAAPVALATAPAAPTGLATALVKGGIEVSWDRGADGGAPIDRYRVVATDVATSVAVFDKTFSSASGACRDFDTVRPTCKVTGLTEGASYTLAVAARNAAVVFSPLSASTAPTVYAAVPGKLDVAPFATAYRSSAVLTWAAAPTDGGAPVTSYTIEIYENGAMLRTEVQSAALPRSRTFLGLSDTAAYRFKVAATNVAGTALMSQASNTVRPQSWRPLPPA